MDIRTGRTYDTREAALAAGVPESDIADMRVTRDSDYWPRFSRNQPVPHQGPRETRRRLRQLASTAHGASDSVEAE